MLAVAGDVCILVLVVGNSACKANLKLMKIDYQDERLEAKAKQLAMFTSKRGTAKTYWIWSTLVGITEIKRLTFDDDGYLYGHSSDLWVNGAEHEFARCFDAFLTPKQAKKLYKLITDYEGAAVK